MTPTAIDGGAGIPPEPNWSTIYDDDLDVAAAKNYWREITTAMREADTLAVVNGHSVQRLVLFRIEFDRSARNTAEQGKIIRAKRTKSALINPEWTCMKHAAEAASDLEAELGLSPRRRAGASKVQRGSRKQTAADSYLKPVSK